MEHEIVICAAILCVDESVIRGHRHGDALTAVRASNKRPIPSRDSQGFVTSRNRFVDRREALRLQLAAGIASVSPGGYRGDQLYSEDLY